MTIAIVIAVALQSSEHLGVTLGAAKFPECQHEEQDHTPIAVLRREDEISSRRTKLGTQANFRTSEAAAKQRRSSGKRNIGASDWCQLNVSSMRPKSESSRPFGR